MSPPALTDASCPPQARCLPSGEKAAHTPERYARSFDGENSRTFSPVRRLHTATKSPDTTTARVITMNSLSGENLIWWGCVSTSRQRSSFPVVASQIRAVPSKAVVATHLPSGEYATDVTHCL